MDSLTTSRGKSLTIFFVIFGLLLGFLVYDGVASPQALHNADCAELEPYVENFVSVTESFMATEPAEWHRVREIYEQHATALRAFRPRSDDMKGLSKELEEAVSAVEGAIYSFNPNDTNRKRLAQARVELDAKFATLAEVCP